MIIRQPIPVTLTVREKEIAWFVAQLRNKKGEEAGADGNKYGKPDKTQLILHYIGCLGEMALAKGLNRYWSGAGQGFHDDDDVGGLQARATKHPDGCLLVRKDDADDAPYFCLIGEDGTYDIVGWAYGYEAKRVRPQERAGRPAAYFYPQHLQRPMSDKSWVFWEPVKK